MLSTKMMTFHQVIILFRLTPNKALVGNYHNGRGRLGVHLLFI
jgi:hypothetical protein